MKPQWYFNKIIHIFSLVSLMFSRQTVLYNHYYGPHSIKRKLKTDNLHVSRESHFLRGKMLLKNIYCIKFKSIIIIKTSNK